jgi:hypothetical protein
VQELPKLSLSQWRLIAPDVPVTKKRPEILLAEAEVAAHWGYFHGERMASSLWRTLYAIEVRSSPFEIFGERVISSRSLSLPNWCPDRSIGAKGIDDLLEAIAEIWASVLQPHAYTRGLAVVEPRESHRLLRQDGRWLRVRSSEHLAMGICPSTSRALRVSSPPGKHSLHGRDPWLDLDLLGEHPVQMRPSHALHTHGRRKGMGEFRRRFSVVEVEKHCSGGQNVFATAAIQVRAVDRDVDASSSGVELLEFK